MKENMSRASSRLRRFTLQSKNVTDNEYLRQLDGGKSMAEKNQWFFEIAWEVANQGIHYLNLGPVISPVRQRH